MKYAVHFLESDQECAVMVSMAMLLSTSDKLNLIWPLASAQDVDFDPTDVEVVVVPLQRLGAPSGMSGAEVFVVYMRSARQEAGSLPPSHALVLKLQKQVEKLAAEKVAADAWPMGASEKFARPIHLYSVRGYSVLVAPFRASVTSIPDEHRLKFQQVLDLYRRILQRDSGAIPPSVNPVEGCVNEVLDLVSEVHRQDWKNSANGRRELRYSEEYNWYLRDTNKTGSKAHKTLINLFGNDAEVRIFGTDWPNPVKLVEQLTTTHNVFQGAYGAVHGDLHPKNIVFDHADKANIIDFGWATSGRHVVVDYLLLDINLRAMTLASQISENQLLCAARCLAPTDQLNKNMDERLLWRINAVREVIWRHAQDKGAVLSADGNEWLHEYMIPYFLVAYGLLVYLDNAQNQRALLACVLAASERIQRELAGIQ